MSKIILDYFKEDLDSNEIKIEYFELFGKSQIEIAAGKYKSDCKTREIQNKNWNSDTENTVNSIVIFYFGEIIDADINLLQNAPRYGF